MPILRRCSKRSIKTAGKRSKCLLLKRKISEINNLNLHLNELEKEQTKPKISSRKEILKIRAEISEIENRKILPNSVV